MLLLVFCCSSGTEHLGQLVVVAVPLSFSSLLSTALSSPGSSSLIVSVPCSSSASLEDGSSFSSGTDARRVIDSVRVELFSTFSPPKPIVIG